MTAAPDFCPFCGSDSVEASTVQAGHEMHTCNRCVACDRKFRVSEPTVERGVRFQ